ncbi:hypothetical protein D3C87_1453210 [compost metagenome]
MPSISIQALTFLRASNICWRSTTRSRTIGKVPMGSMVMVSPLGASFCTSEAQACWGLPLITMEQEPHTCSRQTASQMTGVVFWPWAFTGFRWISIRHMMMFMPLE